MFGFQTPSTFRPTSSTPAFSTPSFGSVTPAFGTPSSTPAFGTPSFSTLTPAFGTPSSTPAFGTPSSTPAFGTPSSTPAFGTPSSTPTFGTPSSTPAFGTSSLAPAFGTPSSIPAFGTPSSSPAFGTPSSTPAFGTPSSTPAFGTPSSTPAFGTSSLTPSFGTPTSTPIFGTSSITPFGTQSSAPGFGTPTVSSLSTGFASLTPAFPSQTQQQTPFFHQPAMGYGLQSPIAATQASPFYNPQLATQLAPLSPFHFSLPDRDIQEIIDAYNEDPGNPKYVFRHLLFSMTEQQLRLKPAAVSDIMWAEALSKLEGMESIDRARLWPQLVQGFKDLSLRLKLQDDVILSDAERLRMTQSNVKMLQRHVQGETLPWIQRMKQKEQNLQLRLLKVMRIIEAMEGKGCRLPVMKGEVELADKLAAISRQLRGAGAELPRRVQNLVSSCCVQANSLAAGGNAHLLGSTKIQEQSLVDLHGVLQQQTEAIARLGKVLKRNHRDMEIIVPQPQADQI